MPKTKTANLTELLGFNDANNVPANDNTEHPTSRDEQKRKKKNIF